MKGNKTCIVTPMEETVLSIYDWYIKKDDPNKDIYQLVSDANLPVEDILAFFTRVLEVFTDLCSFTQNIIGYTIDKSKNPKISFTEFKKSKLLDSILPEDYSGYGVPYISEEIENWKDRILKSTTDKKVGDLPISTDFGDVFLCHVKLPQIEDKEKETLKAYKARKIGERIKLHPRAMIMRTKRRGYFMYVEIAKGTWYKCNDTVVTQEDPWSDMTNSVAMIMYVKNRYEHTYMPFEHLHPIGNTGSNVWLNAVIQLLMQLVRLAYPDSFPAKPRTDSSSAKHRTSSLQRVASFIRFRTRS